MLGGTEPRASYLTAAFPAKSAVSGDDGSAQQYYVHDALGERGACRSRGRLGSTVTPSRCLIGELACGGGEQPVWAVCQGRGHALGAFELCCC